MLKMIQDPFFLTFELHVFTKRIRLSGSDAACGYTAGLS